MVERFLYFEVGCLCLIPGLRITNNVILNKSLHISSYNFVFCGTKYLPQKDTLLPALASLLLEDSNFLYATKQLCTLGINLWALLMKTFSTVVPEFDQALEVLKNRFRPTPN